jgi:hypothetical protein
VPPFPAILHEAKGGMGRDQLPVICDMRRKNVWRFGRESQCYTFDGNSWHPTFETINAIAGVSFEQLNKSQTNFTFFCQSMAIIVILNAVRISYMVLHGQNITWVVEKFNNLFIGITNS